METWNAGKMLIEKTRSVIIWFRKTISIPELWVIFYYVLSERDKSNAAGSAIVFSKPLKLVQRNFVWFITKLGSPKFRNKLSDVNIRELRINASASKWSSIEVALVSTSFCMRIYSETEKEIGNAFEWQRDICPERIYSLKRNCVGICQSNVSQ